MKCKSVESTESDFHSSWGEARSAQERERRIVNKPQEGKKEVDGAERAEEKLGKMDFSKGDTDRFNQARQKSCVSRESVPMGSNELTTASENMTHAWKKN